MRESAKSATRLLDWDLAHLIVIALDKMDRSV